MRTEQQLIRDWVEAQARQQEELKIVLSRLASQQPRTEMPRVEPVRQSEVGVR